MIFTASLSSLKNSWNSFVSVFDSTEYVSDIKNNMATIKFIEKYESELVLDDFCILLYFGRYNKYEKATLIHIKNLNEKLQRNLKLRTLLKSIN